MSSIFLSVASLSLVSCADADAPQAPETEESDSQVVEPSETTPGTSEQEPGEVSAEPQDMLDPLAIPDGIPADFAVEGLPFYQPSTVMVAPTPEGNPYVIELLTDDGLTPVLDFYLEHISAAAGWENVVHLSGEQELITASRNGYDLTLAVAPERMNPDQTSIFYTIF